MPSASAVLSSAPSTPYPVGRGKLKAAFSDDDRASLSETRLREAVGAFRSGKIATRPRRQRLSTEGALEQHSLGGLKPRLTQILRAPSRCVTRPERHERAYGQLCEHSCQKRRVISPDRVGQGCGLAEAPTCERTMEECAAQPVAPFTESVFERRMARQQVGNAQIT